MQPRRVKLRYTAIPCNVYESADRGLTWQEINKTPLFGKEPSLTALASGTLVMSAQKGYFGPGSKYTESINMARSTDGGRTWELYELPGADYPRNMIVEKDGSLLFVRAVKSDWSDSGDGSPNLQLCRSKDGKTWQFSEGAVDWSYAAFGEMHGISPPAEIDPHTEHGIPSITGARGRD